MTADKYLESIELSNAIDEEFFNDDDKSWYKVQELMEAYHKAKLEEMMPSDNIPQPTRIEQLMKEKLDHKSVRDEFGWTGEFTISPKDVLDIIIDLNNEQ